MSIEFDEFGGDDFDDAFDMIGKNKSAEDGGGFATAYRLTGEAKLSGSIDFIETLLEAGAKFLLFAHHKSVLDGYENHLLKKKIGFVRIDGRVNPEKRHERVTKF